MTSPFVSLEQASAHIHRGAGPGSLLQVAGAWGVVAQKLTTAADAVLVVGTWCGGQPWQGSAAQQMREAIISVTQELKHNAVVAEQIETAATTVAAAFNKAQGATSTPQRVADNRENRAWWVTVNALGPYQLEIAELDAAYQVMWVRSIVAYDRYHYDTSHALARVKQTWSPPHQQPADTPTTAGGTHPHTMPLGITSPITQHHDTTAAWARIYALGHALDTIKHQEEYEQHSTYAKMCQGLADHGKATAELYNTMAQHHREAAQLHKNLFLNRADMPALARKYVDIVTTWHQMKQQTDATVAAYHAASKTQPHLQELGDNLCYLGQASEKYVGVLFKIQGLDFKNPDLNSYADKLRAYSEKIDSDANKQKPGRVSALQARYYASAIAGMQDCALDRAEEAGKAWRAAQQHAQPIMDHAHDFFVFFQMAARIDNQATTPASLSA